eukprot:TRINITY_DN3708_c0_g1_i1.p1 TRINITY_DN3708_c0_g1~~TRINITY_DN3708_c0_g1_i1.p1  ORF type:complete len:423 (-),score=99.52 TRINITY_DN3708_c0_g1_i1:50-1246(-)
MAQIVKNIWYGFGSLFSRRQQEEPPTPEPEYGMKNPYPYVPPKFEPNDPAALEYLDRKGYVVFKNIATQEEVETAITLFWDLAEASMPSINRNDPSSWDNPWVASPSIGIMASSGIGQSKFMWHLRTLPKLRQAFAGVWGTDDLLVSFDGCGVFRPPEYNSEWLTHGGWYHVDQHVHKKPGRHAIQGLMNLFPSGPTDGGFVVVPASLDMVASAFEQDLYLKTSNRDLGMMRPEAAYWQDALSAITERNDDNRYDLLPIKPVLDPGDFIMWDSRSVHCNHPPTQLSTDPSSSSRLKRLAAYICMIPAAAAKDLAELAKYRAYAFQNGITTTHWPTDFVPSWGKTSIFGSGADSVELTADQATLITGKQYPYDVYDKNLTAHCDIDDYRKGKRGELSEE